MILWGVRSMPRKKLTEEEKAAKKEAIRQARSDRMKALNAKRMQERFEERTGKKIPEDSAFNPNRGEERAKRGMPDYFDDPDRLLSPFQELFVEEYLKCRNACEACRRAGYSEKHVATTSYRLMKSPAILREIRARQEQVRKDLTVTVDRVVLELAKIAFADMTDFVEFDNGRIMIKPDVQVDGSIINEVSETRNNQGTTVKIKLNDKMAALRMLCAHVGIADKLEVNGKMTLVDLLKALETDASKKEAGR